MLLPWRRRNSSVARNQLRTAEQSLRLRRIFDDTHDLAWRLLRRFGVPAERIEDSFQQVFLIASERLDDITPGSERAFVYGVALRVAHTIVRNQRRELLGDEPDLRAGGQLSADALLECKRLIELCDRILATLEPELREVFILRELEGLTGAETADLLGLPAGTVHSRLRRARLRVRVEIEALRSAASATEAYRG